MPIRPLEWFIHKAFYGRIMCDGRVYERRIREVVSYWGGLYLNWQLIIAREEGKQIGLFIAGLDRYVTSHFYSVNQ